MTKQQAPLFSKIIGQNRAKSKLGLIIDSQNKGEASPHVLLGAGRGLGKTNIMREYGRGLLYKDVNGSTLVRPYLEVNCATVKNCRAFFENIVLQNAICDRPVTVAFDEAHMLPKDVQNMLLTLLNNEKSSIRHYEFGGMIYTFDFKQISFIFATTDTQLLFKPLVDRMEIIDLKTYTVDELKQIIHLHTPNINYEGDALQLAAETVRSNARNAVQRANHIMKYCQSKMSPNFGEKEWQDLCDVWGIFPLGLNEREVAVLRILNKSQGGCALTHLASKTGNSRAVLQHDIEHMLLSMDLIKIDGKRHITDFGKRILNEID